jgi:hypothetical protein
MTRNYLVAAARKRRPVRVVPRYRDASITVYGFTCFRLQDGDPVEVMHSTNTMFAFVRSRR